MTTEKKALRKKLSKTTIWRKPWVYLVILVGVILLLVGLYQIPAVNAKAYYYVSSAWADVFYFFKPPAQVVFNPVQQGTLEVKVAQTLTAMAPTPTQTPTPLPITEHTATPTLTPAPTMTPTPIPSQVKIEGVVWEKQGFNNCGPANLAMALSFWGHKVTQQDTEAVIKPRKEDRNVMPYEMLDYVLNYTPLNGIIRYGGNLELAKEFIAAGFPVLIERGYMSYTQGWMGHYGLLYAYDDEKQEFRIPDSYLGEIKMSYEDVDLYWSHFDYIYLIIYPPEREMEVFNILGPNLDEGYNLLIGLEQVSNRIYTTQGREQFFAWYSRGSILVEMKDYYGASLAYDEAFKVYATLEESERPWRMLWYQTGPYFAYFYSGRYQDTLNLAQQTLDKSVEAAIPETWIWAGRASKMLGNRDKAIFYFRRALDWHPNWWVAEDELRALGEKP